MKDEKVLLNASLCFLVRDGEVLLAKKADKIGKDRWNGYGGGIDGRETPEETVVREFREEADIAIQIEDLEKMAIADFHNTKSDGQKFVCRVHIYIVKKWTGKPKESKEMLTPTWFVIENLPFDEMMPADDKWLPYIFKGKKILVKAHLGPFQKTSTGEVSIKEVENFSNE